MTDNHNWDIVCLQEVWTSAEGVEYEGQHVFFTDCDDKSGFRFPAVLVNARCASNCRILGTKKRGIAVEFGSQFVVVSLHLPHSGIQTEEYVLYLQELDSFLADFPSKRVLLGMDANTRLNCAIDGEHIGHACPSCVLKRDEQFRAALLHEFLGSHGF